MASDDEEQSIIIKKKKQADDSSIDRDTDDDSEDDDFDPEMLGDDINFPALVNHFFTNEDGQNIADILTDLKKSIDTQNKLIYKLVSDKVKTRSEKSEKK
jgi:hypothetical protein